MDHLNKDIVGALELSDDKRISMIRKSMWIGYPRAIAIMNKLEDLLIYPPNHRMPNILVVGDTNNGKTVIVNKFSDRHGPYITTEGDGAYIPVLTIQAPPIPDEKRLYNSILDKLMVPYTISDNADRKQFQVISLLKKINLKVLIIDEIHHILAGDMRKQRGVLNVIKYLGNELRIPIVGVGTKDAFSAIQSDPQLSNRFEPAVLPKWSYNNEYLRLLASYEKILPLKMKSGITTQDIAAKILAMSEGTIGEISTIIKSCAVLAIKSQEEKITKQHLDKINYIPPSMRKRLRETI